MMSRKFLGLALAAVIAAGSAVGVAAPSAQAIEGGTRDEALRQNNLPSDAERSKAIREREEKSESNDSRRKREESESNDSRRDREDKSERRESRGDRDDRGERRESRRDREDRSERRESRRDRGDYRRDRRHDRDRRDYRDRRYDDRRYPPRRRYYDSDYDDVAAGIAGALALGFIARSADISHYPGDWELCEERYPSFRWNDGTIRLYYGGPRELCPYLY